MSRQVLHPGEDGNRKFVKGTGRDEAAGNRKFVKGTGRDEAAGTETEGTEEGTEAETGEA